MATRRPRTRTKQATKAKGPTTVLLVRHGRTSTTGSVLPGRAPGLHLSDEGTTQAEAAAARIAPLQPHAIYASPMERTRETAAPIAKAAGLRTRTAKGLIECDFGDWTGKKLSNLRRKPEWATVQHAPSTFRFPDGESFAQMQQRIWDELERLVVSHPGERIVAVSHADPIKAAVAMASGVHLDNFQRLVVSPCSVTALLFGAGAPIVLCVNTIDGNLTQLAVS
ncbi:MAG: MSMEG_4193 family putative phosphomutase [Actinomycetia bacterium]|nr:MSMEG_4193 family putative phosphomutase [Actinomycetes bacterium]